MPSDQYPKWDYKEYPKTLPADDLWGQVRRTAYGKPVSEDQIQMMVDAIIAGLQLQPASVLLDIGCGNAALTARLFAHFDQCLGVDFSEYLISVANTRFAGPRRAFICSDVVEYAAQEADPLRFDRALCYGMFAYLSDVSAQQLLFSLHERFLNVSSVFIGSLPDPDRAANFFKDGIPAASELNNHQSQIGIWRSRARIATLAEAAGWRARVQDLHPDFYQAHYRYNAILERPA